MGIPWKRGEQKTSGKFSQEQFFPFALDGGVTGP